MKKSVNPSIIAFIFVSVIVMLLLNTGSAKAFNLLLTVFDSSVFKGEDIKFNASIEIEAEDGAVLINNFILRLNGPNNIECRFMPNGTIISQVDCPGITITKLSEAPFGYGYTEGLFLYKIDLDTNNYTAGLYETRIILVKENGEEIAERGEDIRIITIPPQALRGCSVRAVQGDVEVNGVDLDSRNNKLSFFISKSVRGRNDPEVATGQGFLTAQRGKERFEYDFDIDGVIENSADSATMIVSGKYKINRGPEQTLNAMITFAKNRRGFVNITKIPINDINATNMKISFMQGCNRLG